MIAVEADPDRVRLATAGDVHDVLELCRRNHAENGIGDFSQEKALRVVLRCLNPDRNDIGFIGVVGDERIEGSIGIVVEQPWDGETPFLQALWCYVPIEYRASTHHKDLVSWARRLREPAPVGIGLPLWMGAVVSRKTEAQIRLYRRQLGEPCIVSWLSESNADMGAL